MSFRINTNINSSFAGYQLQKSQEDLAGVLQGLSSGKRINRASDDAAGLVIADRLAAQARGYGQGIRNASDAISIAQVAEGAMGQATDLLQGIRVKAIQAGNGSQSPQSLQAIQADISKSLETLGDIAKNTSFNGQKLLSGSFTNRQFQVGPSSGETIELSLGSIDPAQIFDPSLGTLADMDVTTPDGARAAIELTDVALDYVAQQRSQVGSRQNQLASTINNLSNSRINTLASESTIRDLDFAEAAANLNKIELLSKAKTFALAQANASSKRILDIFG
jgi:flagellin